VYEIKTSDVNHPIEYMNIELMYNDLGINRKTVDDNSVMNTLLEVLNEGKQQDEGGKS